MYWQLLWCQEEELCGGTWVPGVSTEAFSRQSLPSTDQRITPWHVFENGTTTHYDSAVSFQLAANSSLCMLPKKNVWAKNCTVWLGVLNQSKAIAVIR